MIRSSQKTLLLTFALVAAIGVGQTALAQESGPVLYSLSPTSGPTGSTVTFKGLRLNNVTKVVFSNNVSAQFTIVDAATITAIVPVGSVTGKPVAYGPTSGSLCPQPFNVTGGGNNGGGNTGGGGNSTPWVAPPNFALTPNMMTGHPRIFVTPTTLPTYQSWAKASNPIWNNLNSFAQKCKSEMDQGKVPALDDGMGLSNFNPYPCEAYAEVFAFMSMVDPNIAARTDWAKRSHDLIMYVINNAAQGHLTTDSSFRGPFFMIHNRSRWFGECFATSVDWAYQTYSAADKAKIRTVFLQWIQDNIYASATSSEHPQPVGVVNSPVLTPNARAVRWAGNNYYCNHARNIGFFSMGLDAADDIPVTATDPAAGALRAYIGNAIGAWLYQVNYNEQTNIAGGVSAEGLFYGESDTSAISMLLLAMNTTQTDNAAVFGPQAAMASGPFWSQEIIDHYVSSHTPQKTLQNSWQAASFLPADYGDTQGNTISNFVRTWTPQLLINRAKGNTAQELKLRWMIENYLQGGSASIPGVMSNLMQTWGPTMGIFYFLALDPNGAAGVDPRPTTPLYNYSTGLGRVLSRTSWNTNASLFTFKCGWNKIDHQQSDGNMIEMYRNGEWLTKNRLGYGFNVGGSQFKNTLSIENPTTSTNWFTAIQSKVGSQYTYSAAGDPTVLSSNSSDYSYAQGDSTNLYNAPSVQATDVLHASRSVIWLKPDISVVYDRADSKTANRFKRFWLNTQIQASVNGKLATANTSGGQKLFVQSVLPATAVVTSQFNPTGSTGPDGGETAPYETMSSRIMIEDPAKPLSLRMLNVVQGADGTGTPVATTAILSTIGDAFEGVAFTNFAVMFQKDLGTLTTTTFTVPSGTTKVYVCGLAAGGSYTVTQSTTATGTTYVIVAGGTTKADSGGVLAL